MVGAKFRCAVPPDSKQSLLPGTRVHTCSLVGHAGLKDTAYCLRHAGVTPSVYESIRFIRISRPVGRRQTGREIIINRMLLYGPVRDGSAASKAAGYMYYMYGRTAAYTCDATTDMQQHVRVLFTDLITSPAIRPRSPAIRKPHDPHHRTWSRYGFRWLKMDNNSVSENEFTWENSFVAHIKTCGGQVDF
jgi:hypothetical protein